LPPGANSIFEDKNESFEGSVSKFIRDAGNDSPPRAGWIANDSEQDGAGCFMFQPFIIANNSEYPPHPTPPATGGKLTNRRNGGSNENKNNKIIFTSA